MRIHRHLHPQSLRAVACSHPPTMATPVQSTYQERGQGNARVAQYKLPRPHWTVMHVRVGHGLVPRPITERERVGARAWKPTNEVAEPASVADGDKQHGAPSFTISVILFVVAMWGNYWRQTPIHSATPNRQTAQKNKRKQAGARNAGEKYVMICPHVSWCSSESGQRLSSRPQQPERVRRRVHSSLTLARQDSSINSKTRGRSGQ